MSTETDSEGSGVLKLTGVGVVLLALLVGIAIAVYWYGSSIFPSELFLGTVVFTVVLIGVGVIAQRAGGRNSVP